MRERSRDNKGYIRDEGEGIPGFAEEGNIGLEDHLSKQGGSAVITQDQEQLQEIQTNESIQAHNQFNVYNFAYDERAAARGDR